MSFQDIKTLVVIGGKEDENNFLTSARLISYRNYEIETSLTNLVSRLQDTSYKACILFSSVIGKEGMARLIARLKGNVQTKQIPIILVEMEPMQEDGGAYYEEGVQIVLEKVNSINLKIALMSTDSWLKFIEQFKEGRERFFRRA